MKEDRPLVSIVMATYNPNLIWLGQQLESLNRQTYKTLELLVLDDCSSLVKFKDIQNLTEKKITNFTYKIFQNDKNLGSNKTFEKLTDLAKGKYIAYCDQDDIWDENKIKILMSKILETKSVMAYSDMRIINSSSDVVADTLISIRPRLEYKQGENLLKYYLFRNCTAGCSMIVASKIAKKSIPFPTETVCDQWIAINASAEGSIYFSSQKLVNYRQHDYNQTGILYGVKDKETYWKMRIIPIKERMEYISKKIDLPLEIRFFLNARINKDIKGIWKYRNFNKNEAYFEMAMIILPNCIIKRMLKFIKK